MAEIVFRSFSFINIYKSSLRSMFSICFHRFLNLVTNLGSMYEIIADYTLYNGKAVLVGVMGTIYNIRVSGYKTEVN